MTERIAYSAREAADALGLSYNRVVELAGRGEIPAVKVGGLWRFPIARVHEWLGGGGVVAAASPASTHARVAS